MYTNSKAGIMRMPELQEMDLRQKIGQMLVTGFPGGEMSPDFKALVREYKVGNVILFQYNQQSHAQLKALCASITEYITQETGVAPFITSDEEGGVVSRLPEDMARMPSAMAQASLGDAERITEAARMTAEELFDVGINFNLAPVLDINNNLDNPVIGVRSYGTGAEEVCHYALAAYRGYAQRGMLTTGKHFPGHGDTNTDSHLALPTIHKTLDELERCELVPFVEAIRAGIPAITIAHILFPALESKPIPATMSTAIITGLLRKRLGFKGLILSDCMEMNAIQAYYGIPEGTVQAVKAGMDFVFISHTPAQVMASAKALEAAVVAGEIPMERIDDAVGRILEYKKQYIQAPADLLGAEREAMRAFAKSFAQDAIAHSRPAGQDCFSLGDDPLFISPERSHITRVSNVVDGAYSFAMAMCKEFGGDAVVIGMNPSEANIAALVARARQQSSVVLGTVNGNVYPGQMELAKALAQAGVPFACVALRNPFEIPLLPEGVFSLALYEYAPQTVELAMDYFKK